MRTGYYLSYVKPIYVSYPSCTCKTIENYGYLC